MQLRIFYQDGHKRVCNVSRSFFETEFVYNGRTKKMEPMTASAKALSLAYYYGARPYHVVLYSGENTGLAVEHKIVENNPPRPERQRPAQADERYVKRELRRLFKNLPIGDSCKEADKYLPGEVVEKPRQRALQKG
jgi:hypothetical protein